MSKIGNTNRLLDHGLHPSHDWWKFEADCWEGEHAYMWCENCEIFPFLEDPCFHELPQSNLTVNPLALRPCYEVES